MTMTFTVLVESDDESILRIKKMAKFEAQDLEGFKSRIAEKCGVALSVCEISWYTEDFGEYVHLDDFSLLPARVKLKLT